MSYREDNAKFGLVLLGLAVVGALLWKAGAWLLHYFTSH